MFIAASTRVTPPERIVSLVPSITELLAFLGLEKQTIGITKFCVHPPDWFATKARIGGTKTVDALKMAALRPDLILANKEENVEVQVTALSEKFPVYLSDVNSFDAALALIRDIGVLANKEKEAFQLVIAIENAFARIPVTLKKQKAAYLIWRAPYMAAGGDTFISSMMAKAGLRNVFSINNRYPEVTIDDIRECAPDLLLLSSEPYPFKQKHIDELQPQLPKTKIVLADGEMFSWYGNRMLYAAKYFASLIEHRRLNNEH